MVLLDDGGDGEQAVFGEELGPRAAEGVILRRGATERCDGEAKHGLVAAEGDGHFGGVQLSQLLRERRAVASLTLATVYVHEFGQKKMTWNF